MVTAESRIYDGIRVRKRSCPAVSQSWSRIVRSSRYIVLLKKSIPMVAYDRVRLRLHFPFYLISSIERVIHKPSDEGCFPHCCQCCEMASLNIHLYYHFALPKKPAYTCAAFPHPPHEPFIMPALAAQRDPLQTGPPLLCLFDIGAGKEDLRILNPSFIV